MARYYTTNEVLEMVLDPDCDEGSAASSEDGSAASSEDGSAASLEDSGDEAEDVSEVETSSSGGVSSENESGERDEEPAEWTAKNRSIVWARTNAQTFCYVPVATGLIPGPTHYATARISDPKSSFALFLTDEMVMIIASMTNLQGRRTIKGWRDVDADEIRAYVGLLILSSVYRSRNESSHSLFSEKTGRRIFRATMSVKRFHHITRALRFDDKLSRPRRRGDKLAPIRRVWDMWVHRLQMLFSPDTDVCVDEQLLCHSKAGAGFGSTCQKSLQNTA